MADKSLIGVHVCPECGKSFETAQGVGAHRARAHGYRRDEPNMATIELVAEAELQRPIDEKKLSEYKGEFLDSVQSSLFENKVEELLPHLAYEALKRLDQGETSLAQAFLILYLDVN